MNAAGQKLSAKEMSTRKRGQSGPITRLSGRVRQVQGVKDVSFVSFAV